MISYRSILRPLIFLVVIGYYFSSALAQPEDEALHKMVVVKSLSILAVGDPLVEKLYLGMDIPEDKTLMGKYFLQQDIDMARREPDAVGDAVYLEITPHL